VVAKSLFPGPSLEGWAGEQPWMGLEQKEGKTVFFLNSQAGGVLVRVFRLVLESALASGLTSGLAIRGQELKGPVECL